MCQIFIDADPTSFYASRSRSIRLRGVATSLRLENSWRVLEEIGARDGLSVPQLLPPP